MAGRGGDQSAFVWLTTRNWASPAWLAIRRGQALPRFRPPLREKTSPLRRGHEKGERAEALQGDRSLRAVKRLSPRKIRGQPPHSFPLGWATRGLRPPSRRLCSGLFQLGRCPRLRERPAKISRKWPSTPEAPRKALLAQGGQVLRSAAAALSRSLSEDVEGAAKFRRGGSPAARVLKGRDRWRFNALHAFLQANEVCSGRSRPPGVRAREQPARRIGQLPARASEPGRKASSCWPGRAAPPHRFQNSIACCCTGQALAATWARPHRGAGAVRRSVPAAPAAGPAPGRGVLLFLFGCWWTHWPVRFASAATACSHRCSSLARPPVVWPTAPWPGSVSRRPCQQVSRWQAGFAEQPGRCFKVVLQSSSGRAVCRTWPAAARLEPPPPLIFLPRAFVSAPLFGFQGGSVSSAVACRRVLWSPGPFGSG